MDGIIIMKKKIEIEFIGHSTFLIKSEKETVLTDPYIDGNPQALIKADDVNASHILVSHAHFDHIQDADKIAMRCKATVFCIPELNELFSENVNIENGQPGGNINTSFGRVKFLTALHSAGIKGAVACGFLIEIYGRKIYFAGDTALNSDMNFISDEKIDIALLPIGDRFTMGKEDAVKAIELIKPKVVIPMHYNTFPEIIANPEEFAELAERKTKSQVIVMKPGENIIL